MVSYLGDLNPLGRLRQQLTRLVHRMIKVSDAYGWEDIRDLTEEDMDNLLKFFSSGKVPTLDQLLAMRANPPPSKMDIFDGSFGFSVGC